MDEEGGCEGNSSQGSLKLRHDQMNMSISSYRKVSQGEVKGWIKEEIIRLLLPTFFGNPISSAREMNAQVIKESRLKWAAILTLPNGQRVFLKRDRTKGWPESLKYVFSPSKGRKEWFMAHQLKERNLSIPEPFGWMEKIRRGFVKESYYLSEAIGSGTSLIDDPLKLGESSSIDELARIVRKIHDSGLFHEDLHAGNFLWDGQSIFLTDLHRGKIIRSLSLKQRLWNLSQLFHSLRSVWREGDQVQFVKTYFEGDPIYFQKKEDWVQKIDSSMEQLQKRQWKSRAKRCLKESTEFSIEKGKGVRYYHRRDLSLVHLKRMLEEHLRWVEEKPSSLAKYSPEVMVSILKDGEKKISVKQFRYPHFWDVFKEHFRRSKGLKAWLAGNGLRARGIPSLLPLALVEEKNWFGWKEAFLVMEAHEMGREMDRYMLEGLKDFRKRRLFIKAFGQWLSHFHKMNLYHQDMKTCNLLISEKGETWDFHLLDLEDVRLDEKVDGRKLFRNLLQLNTSTPRVFTRVDRFRFFREYLRFNPIVKDERNFLKRLNEESRKRGLVYVSPDGVVVEPMG